VVAGDDERRCRVDRELLDGIERRRLDGRIDSHRGIEKRE
jgi:hypothetical protein